VKREVKEEAGVDFEPQALIFVETQGMSWVRVTFAGTCTCFAYDTSVPIHPMIVNALTSRCPLSQPLCLLQNIVMYDFCYNQITSLLIKIQ